MADSNWVEKLRKVGKHPPPPFLDGSGFVSRNRIKADALQNMVRPELIMTGLYQINLLIIQKTDSGLSGVDPESQLIELGRVARSRRSICINNAYQLPGRLKYGLYHLGILKENAYQSETHDPGKLASNPKEVIKQLQYLQTKHNSELLGRAALDIVHKFAVSKYDRPR